MRCAALLLLALASLLPAAGSVQRHSGLGHTALEERRQAARRQWGGVDLVVVVTWFNQALDWLVPEDQAPPFPLPYTRFVLYNKGGPKSCETDVPQRLRPYVLQCERLHNAGGREAHSIALFVTRHYRALPRLVFFSHDDTRAAHLPRAAGIDVLGYPTPNPEAWAAWVELAESKPFTCRELCLCDLEYEQGWAPETYGWWGGQTWFMGAFLEMDAVARNWTSVRWPAKATLLVPAVAIRRRPVTVYSVILQLLNGTSPYAIPEIARQCQPHQGGQGELRCEFALTPDTRLVHDKRAMVDMAHVFERTWLAIFDREYSPDPARYSTAGTPCDPNARGAGRR